MCSVFTIINSYGNYLVTVTMGTDEMVVLALCFIEVCGNMNHSCTKIQKSTWINRPPILSNEGKHLTFSLGSQCHY